MKSKYLGFGILILGVIGLVFMSGCTQQEITCDSPYIKVGNICCLDENNNNICDTDETSNIPQQQTYCGDGTCQSDENCNSCPSDCGKCKKSIGESCSYNTDCSEGYCVHNYCRGSSTYCGDHYCDSGESYNSCPSDCEPEIKIVGKQIRVNDYSNYDTKFVDYQREGDYYFDESVTGSNIASFEVTIKNIGTTAAEGITISSEYNFCEENSGPCNFYGKSEYAIWSLNAVYNEEKIVKLDVDEEATIKFYVPIYNLPTTNRYFLSGWDFKFISEKTPLSLSYYISSGSYHISKE